MNVFISVPKILQPNVPTCKEHVFVKNGKTGLGGCISYAANIRQSRQLMEKAEDRRDSAKGEWIVMLGRTLCPHNICVSAMTNWVRPPN